MLGLRSSSPLPSSSLTTLVTAPRDSAVVRDWLEKERGLTLMGGQDQLKGKILRVGHMGDVRNEDMMALFEALSEAFDKREEYARREAQWHTELKGAEPLFT